MSEKTMLIIGGVGVVGYLAALAFGREDSQGKTGSYIGTSFVPDRQQQSFDDKALDNSSTGPVETYDPNKTAFDDKKLDQSVGGVNFLDSIIYGVKDLFSTTDLRRGERNNNPMNIKRTGDNWDGLAMDQTDPVFFTFKSAEYGIRAGAKILDRYMSVYGLRSVRGIISRWSPASENGSVVTNNYVDYVSKIMSVFPDSPIDNQDIPNLVDAIIRFENGRNIYTAYALNEGIRLSGVIS